MRVSGVTSKFSTRLTTKTDISQASLVWMLQCISPHLTIDQSAFNNSLEQYKRWLFHIRFACTYHHPTKWDRIKAHLPKAPIIPIINPARSELDPPRRDSPHKHPEFDFSWGTGPIVDSFGGIYHFVGSHSRRPGGEDVEVYNREEDVWSWEPLRSLGHTNEYIHPIAYHRSLICGWEKHSPLRKGWTREHRRGEDGKARFWWHMQHGNETTTLPEWAILPDLSTTPNFERAWYSKCEKTKRTLDGLKKVKEFGTDDFLSVLDKDIDFGFDMKPQNLWP